MLIRLPKDNINKMEMKKYGQGLFLSPKNTEEGDIITFTDEGVEGDFDGKPNVTFEVELDGEFKKLTINPTSVQNLAEAWGWNSEQWIGKCAKISYVEKPIQGQLTKYIVLEPIESAQKEVGKSDVEDEDIPVIEEAEEPKTTTKEVKKR